MENCFVKNLKVDFDDSKLLTMTQIPIEVHSVASPTEKNSKIRITYRSTPSSKTVSDGGAIALTYAELETNPQTELSGNGTGVVYVKNANFIVKADSKDEIEAIIIADGNGTNPLSVVDLDYLGYLARLIDVRANNGAAKGNIKNLPITITQCLVNGSSKVFGCIESLCELQLQKGRTSGTLVLAVPTSVIFHNTSAQLGNYSIVFSSNSCTISYGGSQVASYDGATWTYSN